MASNHRGDTPAPSKASRAGNPSGHPSAVFLAELLVWACLTLGVWVVTLSSVPLGEMAIGAGAGLGAAVVATLARRALGGRWRPSPRWVAWVPHLVVSVPRDTLTLYVSALRRMGLSRSSVEFEVRSVQLPPEAPETRAARLALGTLMVAATPGTVVIDEDPDSGELVVHGLTRGPSSLERRVASAAEAGGKR